MAVVISSRSRIIRNTVQEDNLNSIYDVIYASMTFREINRDTVKTSIFAIFIHILLLSIISSGRTFIINFNLLKTNVGFFIFLVFCSILVYCATYTILTWIITYFLCKIIEIEYSMLDFHINLGIMSYIALLELVTPIILQMSSIILQILLIVYTFLIYYYLQLNYRTFYAGGNERTAIFAHIYMLVCSYVAPLLVSGLSSSIN